MSQQDDLRKLRDDLRKSQEIARRLQMNMASGYISHAIDNVEEALAVTPSPPSLRSIKGGKGDS